MVFSTKICNPAPLNLHYIKDIKFYFRNIFKVDMFQYFVFFLNSMRLYTFLLGRSYTMDMMKKMLSVYLSFKKLIILIFDV